MAQSSNYKQYNRTTRVLTEESGFAGGMLWTDNNIDETHLKAIVNCDYGDTTGYLKTRDPFVSISAKPATFENKRLLTDRKLLGAFNICPFDMDNDESTLPAGWLYIFAETQKDTDVLSVIFNNNSIVCVFKTEGDDNDAVCRLELKDTVLRNIIPQNMLLRCENYLYGIGSEGANPESWQQVFRLETHVEEDAVTGKPVSIYTLRQLDYNTELLPKINSVTLLEACVSGFNAARGKETFTYGSEIIDLPDESPEILGVYFKDASGNTVVSPRIGQPVQVSVPLRYHPDSGKKHYLGVFQYKEGADSTDGQLTEPWDFKKLCEVIDQTDDGILVEFKFDFTFSKKNTMLYLTYYGTNPNYVVGDPSVKYTLTYAEPEDWKTAYNKYYKLNNEKVFVQLTSAETWAASKYYTREAPKAYDVDSLCYHSDTYTANSPDKNLKVKNYNLNSAYGSCMWRNRMCLWGTQGDYNCLFLSEVDNFYYYPIPNNVAVFDTNVISCIPYKDSLLVFTADKIYRVIENNDGSFVQTVVQNDMPMSKADSAYLTAIKNMVLFKSGNYFYMIVPKSQSLTDELSVAPIYKNVAGLLNNLDKSVQEMLQLLYPEYLFREVSLSDRAPCAVYSEQDTVRILYDVRTTIVFKSTDATSTVQIRTFKMFLNYNTNLRAWTLYLVDTTEHTLEVAALTTARSMSFIRVNKDDSSFNTVVQQRATDNPETFRILLDTGYRTLSTATQKRFREIQLKLYSATENTTAFGTAFLVDGVWRRNYTKLSECVTSDNTISLMPDLDLNTLITETTMALDDLGNTPKGSGSDSIELLDWMLDFSHFKRGAPVTVRIPVSGKGFNPRFILMIPDAIDISINEINWVYRLMHGR